jgi:hypothetical protein
MSILELSCAVAIGLALGRALVWLGDLATTPLQEWLYTKFWGGRYDPR